MPKFISLAISSVFVSLLLSLTSTLSQEAADIQEPVTLRNPVISADGAWIAAEERLDWGDGSVRLWSTEDDATFTIERGLSPRISNDSRWVSALQKTPLEESRTATPKNQRAGQTLVLLNSKDGSRMTFDYVLSNSFTVSSGYLVYLSSSETKAAEEKPANDTTTKRTDMTTTEESNLGTLHFVYLNSDSPVTIASLEKVTHYVTHPTYAQHRIIDHLAYVFYDEETGRDRLRVVQLSDGNKKRGNWGVRGEYAGHKINNLRWANDATFLAFMDNPETSSDDERSANNMVFTWHDEPGRSELREFKRIDSSSLPAQVVPIPASNHEVVGQLQLPPGSGSRGMHVIIDVVNHGTKTREWLKLDEKFRFRSSFTGTLTKLEIATGVATIVHRLNAQELARLTKQATVDVGAIDLRKRLQAHKIKLLSDNATTLRIGMSLKEPARDFTGSLPSLGSRQFPEIEAGKEMNWLLPSEFDTAYFLVEEPADERRGREWRSGKQKLFGPFRSSDLPTELKIQ